MNAILAPVMVSSFSAQISKPTLSSAVTIESQPAISPGYESLLEDTEITESPCIAAKNKFTLATPESLSPSIAEDVLTVEVESVECSI